MATYPADPHGRRRCPLREPHKPDLILMDIQLPEVSGLEVTRWIKEDDDLRISR